MFNPYIRGWINYCSHFYRSALYPTLRRIDAFLLRWARRKFKLLRQRPKSARDWLARVIRSSPEHFCPLAASLWSRPYTGSCMSREAHVRGEIPSSDSLALNRQSQRYAREGVELR
jgi:RNA-directed DNA polymerase